MRFFWSGMLLAVPCVAIGAVAGHVLWPVDHVHVQRMSAKGDFVLVDGPDGPHWIAAPLPSGAGNGPIPRCRDILEGYRGLCRIGDGGPW